MSFLKISFVSLFPEMFTNFINSSIIKNAILENKIQVENINFRDYSKNKHKKVDDYPYGGGPGMVIGIQSIADCLKDIKTDDSLVVLMSPRGEKYNQSIANEWIKKYKEFIFVCGHYEGFDERIIHYVDKQISIGDYIITGGELPAMVIADSLIRLADNVINPSSLDCESFTNNLFDYPVYTKPYEFDNHRVPDILLSGNHKLINEYRLKEQIRLTKKSRPDLYKKYIQKGEK